MCWTLYVLQHTYIHVVIEYKRNNFLNSLFFLYFTIERSNIGDKDKNSNKIYMYVYI